MADRYERVFSLTGNLHAVGAPVIVLAGALLKDTTTGAILAQLKYKNIGSKSIKAIKTTVFPLDTVNQPIEGEVTYEYLDLSAARDDEFGQKTAIPMPNSSTRAFRVEVCEIAFDDNTTWTTNGTVWESLPDKTTLDKTFDDPEMVKQYRIKYGNKAGFTPAKVSDLWYCTCGAVNEMDEETCHICGNKLSELLALDIDELALEKQQRISEEKAEQAAKAAIEKEKRAKVKKGLIIGFSVFAVLALILTFTVFLPNHRKAEQNAKINDICMRGVDQVMAQTWPQIGYYFRDTKDTVCKSKTIEYTKKEINGDSFYVEGIAKLNGAGGVLASNRTIYITLSFVCDGSFSGDSTIKTTNVETEIK